MRNKNKEPKYIKVMFGIFYGFLVAFLIAFAYYFYKEYVFFDVREDNVDMIVGSDFPITLMGRIGERKTYNYEYTSLNDSIVEVSEDGVIHSISEGETKVNIKSKIGSYERNIDVVVLGTSIYSLEFDNDNIIMESGEKYEPKPIINNSSRMKANINWSTSNNKVATFVDGNIVAKNKGVAYITAKVEGTNISGKIKVTVNKKSNKEKAIVDKNINDDEIINDYIGVNSIKITSDNKSIKVGEQLKLKYEIIPSNASNKKVSWSSNNKNVISVNKEGLITGKSVGNANIIVRTEDGNKSTFISINVTKDNKNLEKVMLNKNKISLVTGDNEKLIVKYDPEDAVNKNVTWSSSNESVAVVDKNGLVTAKKEGTSIITVKSSNGKESKCEVNVINKAIEVKSIELNNKNIEINENDTYQLKVIVTPEDATDNSITWSTSDASIARVDSNGIVTAVSRGSANITATSKNGKFDICKVKVYKIDIESIALNKSDFQVSKGSNFAVAYSVSPSNASNKKLIWTSSDTSVAMVDNNGNVKPIGYGITTIKASANDGSGKFTFFNLTVVPKGNIIDIRDKNTNTSSKYKSYYSEIQTTESGDDKFIQNFAISNIGKENEKVYLTTSEMSNISSARYATSHAAKLTRTIVYTLNKNTLNNTKRPTMFFEQSGHGHVFDIEENSNILWIGYYGGTHLSNNAYWGDSEGIIRVKFTENSRGSKIEPLQAVKILDDSGEPYINLIPSIDVKNDLIAMSNPTRSFVYKYSDFKKGKMTLVYSFKFKSELPSKYENTKVGISSQGIVIKDGYMYQIYGAKGYPTYIQAFDLQGVSQYISEVKGSFNGRENCEAEGIRVYNNKIYIGSAYTKNKHIYYDIGYFN